ncbi:MAG: hypothetical protein QXG39_08030 [Candidatus Aenigmatarchaeota archaeon]
MDVGSNNKKTIDCHGICKIVTNNNCSASVFVPTKTSTEWSEFLSHFPSCVSVTDCCTNECSYSGQTEYRCSGSWVQYRTCGNYDSDPCLEWSSWSNYENCDSYDGCSGGYYYNYYCSNGYCDYSSSCTETCCDEYYGDSRAYCSGGYCYGPPSCTNECSYSGQTECCDSWSYRTCGNYDSDSCLEWSSCSSCPSGQTCSGGVCSGGGGGGGGGGGCPEGQCCGRWRSCCHNACECIPLEYISNIPVGITGDQACRSQGWWCPYYPGGTDYGSFYEERYYYSDYNCQGNSVGHTLAHTSCTLPRRGDTWCINETGTTMDGKIYRSYSARHTSSGWCAKCGP